MNREEMMGLKPGDVVAVKYADAELPTIEIIKRSATEDYLYTDFEAGYCRKVSNGSQMIKIGHVKRTFEFN